MESNSFPLGESLSTSDDNLHLSPLKELKKLPETIRFLVVHKLDLEEKITSEKVTQYLKQGVQTVGSLVFEVGKYTVKKTPEWSEMILSQMFYLYEKLKSVTGALTSTGSEIAELAEDIGSDWVIVKSSKEIKMKEVNEEKKENGSKGEEQLAEDYNLKYPANSFRGLDSIEKSVSIASAEELKRVEEELLQSGFLIVPKFHLAYSDEPKQLLPTEVEVCQPIEIEEGKRQLYPAFDNFVRKNDDGSEEKLKVILNFTLSTETLKRFKSVTE